MPLPDLIEIIPPANGLTAEITVPGSKSITNRALLLAALASGETTLRHALWSEDTQVMVESLHRLGVPLTVSPDADEESNRTIRVDGRHGQIREGGSVENPLEIFVGNAGTAARFLAAFVCLGRGAYRLAGVPRMHERPQAALFEALRQLGYSVDSPNNKLPAVIHGGGRRPGSGQVSINESSQFASALLLCAARAGWQVEVLGKNPEELPYVEMTRHLVKAFPRAGGEFVVEPDASSGSYFVAADWLLDAEAGTVSRSSPGLHSSTAQRAPGRVRVRHWPVSGWQIDAAFPKYLPLPEQLSRARHLGDSIMTAIALAPLAAQPVRFTDLEPLRLQECERVAALRTELTRCGAKVVEEGHSLTVYPSALRGAEIETYNDHRMAMCFATLGLKVSGIKLKNPACVKKTFPNFFQKLAAAPPGGLGVRIINPATGRALGAQELIADMT